MISTNEITFQRVQKVQNAGSVYQQWEFNDLTQHSQYCHAGKLKYCETYRKKKQKASTNYFTFSKPISHIVECEEVSITVQNHNTENDPYQNPKDQDLRNARLNGTSLSKSAPKLGKNYSNHKKKTSLDRKSTKNKQGTSNHLKIYGKIKIFAKKPIDNSTKCIFPNNKKAKIKTAQEVLTMNEDPFAFVTIMDEIQLLNPLQACLKVSGEFIAVNENIKAFEEKWTHRKYEFLYQNRYKEIQISAKEN